MDPRVVHHHAPKKTQTTTTFLQLLTAVDTKMASVRRRTNLPSEQPCIIVVDNAPSHCSLPVVIGGIRQCDKLVRFSDTCFLYLTIKNRSHFLNSGDQLINRTLRQVCYLVPWPSSPPFYFLFRLCATVQRGECCITSGGSKMENVQMAPTVVEKVRWSSFLCSIQPFPVPPRRHEKACVPLGL
jgi:hypothetical protein